MQEKQESNTQSQYLMYPEPSQKLTRSMEHDFYCPWTFDSCARMEAGFSAHLEEVSYNLCGHIYTGEEAFCKEKICDYPEYANPKSTPCEVSAWRDIYGAAVLRIMVQIPTFDSDDRVYDSYHALYLTHNGEQIYGIYCGAGYHIGQLYHCKRLQKADSRVRSYMEELGFPVEKIQFL